MNILVINHYAGAPMYGMAYRPYYMGREWVRMGHRVTVVGANFSHLRTRQPVVKEEIIEGIRYKWMETPSYQGNNLSRIKNMLTFLKRLFMLGNRLAKTDQPDLVIASSTYPLDNYVAKYIANKSKAKYIYEVHDLWPLSPMEIGHMSKFHPFIIVMQMAENFAYRHADKVVSLLPKAEQHMLEHGLGKGKFVYIPNGIDIDEWKQSLKVLPKEHGELLQRLHYERKFIVGYVGGHAASNALIFLLRAAEHMMDENVVFVFVGKGVEKERLCLWAKKHRLDNVYFLPPVLKGAMPSLLEKMDALYIGWNHVPLYRFGICPNKLFDYMMAAKPIIHSVTAGNDLVAEAECGISVPAEDVQAITEAIIKMKNFTVEKRTVMGQRGQAYVLAHHDYKVLARKFLERIQERQLVDR